MILSDELLLNLQQLKDQSGLTNEEIGRLAGVSTATARRYISGEVKDAPRSTVEKIITAMGGDISEILGKKDEPDMEIYKAMLQDLRSDHKEEIARLVGSHDKIVTNKDKWMSRLFWVCLALGVLFVVTLVWAFKLDSMISDFGFVQWVE